jgi:hypothetical protein
MRKLELTNGFHVDMNHFIFLFSLLKQTLLLFFHGGFHINKEVDLVLVGRQFCSSKESDKELFSNFNSEAHVESKTIFAKACGVT